MPATVSSENDDGRSAWRNSTCMGGRPLARAMRMKSSWRVAIMSLRSRRANTAMVPAASAMTGMMIDLMFLTGSWLHGV